MYQNVKTVLYHGTVSEIKKIDVSLGRDRKDFGKGFYIAVTKAQAIGMMHKKYREVVRRSRNKNTADFKENLYEIKIKEEALADLKIKVFEESDIEWLEFVLMCRGEGGVPHDYDLVIGPTADDDTAFCLKAYIEGLYGKVGTLQAKEILLKNLETENLGVQYFIGKQEIVDKIIDSIAKIDWR